ncbi:MAG: hypothetical protein R2863_06870 [Candidatus Kapaibacterium sp.]
MSRINPIKINKPEPYLLQAEWSDGKKAIISLEMLGENAHVRIAKVRKLAIKFTPTQ